MATELQNLNPAPGEHGVTPSKDLSLDVVAPGSGVQAASVVLKVNGVLAWSGDAQQTGFVVGKTAITDGFNYVINPDAVLPDGLTYIDVYAVGNDASVLSTQYLFRVGPFTRQVTEHNAGMSDAQTFKTAGGPTSHTEPVTGRGVHPTRTGGLHPESGMSDTLDIPALGTEAGGVPASHTVPQRPTGVFITRTSGISDNARAWLDEDPDYAAHIDDGDGNAYLGDYGILDVLRYDATLDPWHSPTAGFHGVARDGSYHYDGTPCAPGIIGTQAAGINRVSWTGLDLPEPNSDRWFGTNAAWAWATGDWLHLYSNPTFDGWAGCGLGTKRHWFLTGDFDLEIEFKEFSSSGGSDGGAYIEAYIDIGNYFYCRRHLTAGFDSDVKINGSWGRYVNNATFPTSGKFRLVRSGSNVSTYFDSGGGWTLLRSVIDMGSSAPMYLQFGIAGNGGRAINVKFNNFQINSGATDNKAGWWREAFSSTRGSQQEFPEQSLWVLSRKALDIIDLDNNKLWMRFERSTSQDNALHNFGTMDEAFRQRPRRIVVRDGTALLAYGSDIGQSEGGGIWINFNADAIRIHREEGSTITGGDLNTPGAPAGNWSRDISRGHIWARNAGLSYTNDHNNWRIPDYRVSWVDLVLKSGYEYRVHATQDGVSIHRWQRWCWSTGSGNTHWNKPDWAFATEVPAGSNGFTWCYLDPATLTLYYSDGQTLYSVDQATWEAGFTTNSFGADNSKALPPGGDNIIEVFNGFIYFGQPGEGIYRISWPSGSWQLVYSPVGHGGTYEVFPQHSRVNAIRSTTSGGVPYLVVGQNGNLQTEELLDLLNLNTHAVVDRRLIKAPYATAVAA